ASVLAATIKVQSQSDFTTENPSETLTVKAVTDLILDDGFLIINEGYILKGDIVDVSSPKRLKRDASFAFILKEYTDNNGETHKVDSLVKGKFTTKFDYKSAAKSAALGVGSYFVKGLSSAYAAVEGAIKNEEGNRFKSGAISLYESTPISYVEKGEDIVIKKDQVFILNFKLKDEKDEPNYEYTEQDKSGENAVSDDSKDSIKPVNSTDNASAAETETIQEPAENVQTEIKEPLPEKPADNSVSEPSKQVPEELDKIQKPVPQAEDQIQETGNEIKKQQSSEPQMNKSVAPKNIEDQRINHSTSAEHLEEVLKSTYPAYTPAEIPSESLAPLELPFSN
ncbi:TPA: hypothetical protein IAD41_02005, partial [Candidatus Scatenecus faecavium]|nr:hypothetical protein [Candidatus Scatenecus faecavium]